MKTMHRLDAIVDFLRALLNTTWETITDEHLTRTITIAGIYITFVFLLCLALYMLYLTVQHRNVRLIDKMFTWFVWAELGIVVLAIIRVNTGMQFTIWNSLGWINMAAAILCTAITVVRMRRAERRL